MRKIIAFSAGLVVLAAIAAPPLEKAVSEFGTLREITPEPTTARAPQREAALQMPVTFALDSQADFDLCTVVDANEDGVTWKYSDKSGCYSAMTGSVTSPADDWLILPVINFGDKEKNYSMTVNISKLVKAETIEICISKDENTENAVTIYSGDVEANSFSSNKSVTVDFSVVSPGDYYLMFHAITETPGNELYVSDINIWVNKPQTFTVPFEMAPATDEVKHFTVINSDDDDKTWFFDSNNNGFAIESHKEHASNDYLKLPTIEIEEAGNYKFSWNARVWGEPQSVEVLIGEGDDLADYRTIFSEPSATGTYKREVVFTVDEPGEYQLVFHCTTPANSYKLVVKDFSLVATDEEVAQPLPLHEDGPLTVGTEGTFSSPFTYEANTRVKLTFEATGGDVTVGLGNAPAAEAMATLFTTESAEGNNEQSQVFILPGEGIGYLGFTAAAEVEISNINLMTYTEEDEAYQLPFSMQPTKTQFLEFQVVNANNDDATWIYYEEFGAARATYSTQNKSDDWLIFPAINVPSTGEMLSFSMNVRGMAVTLPETFEVWVGKTADTEEMVKLYESGEIRTETFQPVSFSFTPQWTGITHFAIRSTSEPKMFYLFVRDFAIKSDGRSSAIPRTITDLSAKAEGQGSLNAIVTFTMPTVSEAGDAMASDAELTAEITTRAGSTTVKGTPGEKIETTVESGQGMGEITVTVSNAEGKSNPTSTSVYTGQDTPSAANVTGLKADKTNRSVVISWELPEEGANGGYVDPEKVTYTVLHSTGSGSYLTIAKVEGKCEYTYTIPESYPLEMHYFTVKASNVAGEGESGKGTGIMLGKPYSIPAIEDFSNGTITLGPIGMSTPDSRYTLGWHFDNPAFGFDEAANLSGAALIAYTEEYGPARGRLSLPKFDTRGDNGARVVLRLFNYPHFAETDVYAEIAEGEPVLIGHIAPAKEAGWKEYSLPLPQSLLNQQWIAPYIDFGFDGTNDDEIWMLDRYGMENYYECEIDVRPLITHTLVKAFETTVWTAEIGNYGRTSVTFDTPELCFTDAEGNVDKFAATKSPSTITLETGENIVLTYEVVLGTDMEGEIAYDLIVNVEDDANADNNYFAGTTEVWQQEEFVVRDLKATREADGVHLSWTAPSTGYGILYVDNLRSWEYGSQIGLFTNYDGDGQPLSSFSGATFPGMGVPKGWQVFDYEDAGFDYVYAGYLGSPKSLIAFSPAYGYGAADDWLISPEVRGGTKLDFEVRPLHFGYGREKIEILTSSTTPDPKEFTLLTTYLTEDGDKDKTPYWENVIVTLPEDARYFAIRYASNDIFGVQLDDVIYTPAQEDEGDITYSVFHNGKAIETGVSDTKYLHVSDAAGTYQVAAEKLFGGLHPLSNRVSVEMSGIEGVEAMGVSVTTENGYIVVAGAEGKAVSVTATDGRVLYSTASATSETRIALPAGVYIVTVETTAVKALVP